MTTINSEQAQTAAELWHSKLMAANGRRPNGQPFLVQKLNYDALRADGAVLVSAPDNRGGLFIIVFSDQSSLIQVPGEDRIRSYCSIRDLENALRERCDYPINLVKLV